MCIGRCPDTHRLNLCTYVATAGEDSGINRKHILLFSNSTLKLNIFPLGSMEKCILFAHAICTRGKKKRKKTNGSEEDNPHFQEWENLMGKKIHAHFKDFIGF